MFFRQLFLLLLFCHPFLAQEEHIATLTLVEEDGVNEAEISLDVAVAGRSSDSAKLSGEVVVQLKIDPATGTTTELTVLSAKIDTEEDGVQLESGNFLASYDIQSSGLGVDIKTTDPPGIVDPETGEFEGDQFELLVNRGTLKGDARILGDDQEIEFDFKEEPLGSPGAGQGTSTLSPLGIDGRKLRYQVTIELPLDIDQEVEIEGSPFSADAKVEGRFKATGETFAELIAYDQWKEDLESPQKQRGDFGLSDSVPNALYFALGFPATGDTPKTLFQFDGEKINLKVGTGVALDKVKIERSADLESWTLVPEEIITEGKNSYELGEPLGEGVEIRVDPSATWFFRAVNP